MIAIDLTNKVVLKLEISACCSSMIVLSSSPDADDELHMVPVCDRCRAKLDVPVVAGSWIIADMPSFVKAEEQEMEEIAFEAAKGETDLNICGVLMAAYKMVYTNQIDKEKLLEQIVRAFCFGRRMSNALIEYHDTFGERMIKAQEEDIDKESEKRLKQMEKVIDADKNKPSRVH